MSQLMRHVISIDVNCLHNVSGSKQSQLISTAVTYRRQ